MSSIKLRIPHTPKAKASVRTGKYGRYNPSVQGMTISREHVKRAMKGHRPLKGPLLLIVHYRIPAPLSLTAEKRRQQNNWLHIKRPDADNLDKFLGDALNGLLWEDDARIAWTVRSKTITDAKVGETIVYVRELESKTTDYAAITKEILENIEIKDEHENT